MHRSLFKYSQRLFTCFCLCTGAVSTTTHNASILALFPRVKLYVICHDNISFHQALNFTKTRPWTEPVLIKSTVFFESIAFRDVLPFRYREWKNLDYAGIISYKAATTVFEGTEGSYSFQYNPSGIDSLIASAHATGYEVLPFLRSSGPTLMKGGVKYHGKGFKRAWDTLLHSMGFNSTICRKYDESHAFYRNSFLARPAILVQCIQLMNLAMQTAIFDENAATELQKNAGYFYVVKEVAQLIYGQSKYYEYHPFVFERLPVFFFNYLNAKICIGYRPPCINNYV